VSSWTTFPATEPPQPVRALAEQVTRDGGYVLAAYQDPVGEQWQLFCLLPIERVEPTPYQRNLSPTHVKRLQEVIRKLDRFIDPIVAVSPRPGTYWTPNGSHRLEAARKLKAEVIPAILIPDPAVAFHILALNTEKAHNLKEKSLEVIRMYRGLVQERPRDTEEDYAFQFESAHYITLGLLYEGNPRFAGGAFAPLLRRVDKFLKTTLPKALDTRQERAALVRQADQVLTDVVTRLRRRGINHPYVKNYVLARTTPLTRARKTVPSFETAMSRLIDNLTAFDVNKVRYEDIARAALMAPPGG
jgi:ParB family chromosome partitioning protein